MNVRILADQLSERIQSEFQTDDERMDVAYLMFENIVKGISNGKALSEGAAHVAVQPLLTSLQEGRIS